MGASWAHRRSRTAEEANYIVGRAKLLYTIREQTEQVDPVVC